MSEHYAEQRIRDALAAAKGNHQKARKVLEKWCIQDSRLLRLITAPHMTGILAHAIEHVERKISRGEPSPQPMPIIDVDENIDFGKELLKNFAMGKPPKFAQESFSAPLGRKKASQSHINAINLLAGKKKK